MNRQQRRTETKRTKPSAVEEFNLGAAAMAEGQLEPAEAHLRRSLALRRTREAHHNLGSVLVDKGALAEAVGHFRQALRHSPSDSRHHNSLVKPLSLLGRRAEAIAAGSRTLVLKDTEAMRAWSGTAATPSHPLASRGQIDVVAFSLWGDSPLYARGAVENAESLPKLLPGWECRIYHDDSVPPAILSELASKGTRLVAMPPHRETGLGLFWRFFAACDPSVRRFLCRDADSRPSLRETAAIESWIDSGRDFHIMRDDVLHCELMLAGLWGGKSGLLPGLPERCAAWQRNNPHRMNARVEDQRFLRFEVWPRVRARALVHDSTYRFLDSVDFPGHAPSGADDRVGLRRQPGA
jgi:hypothetical protein